MTPELPGPRITRLHGAEAIDISLPISPDMLTWPGNPSVALVPKQRIANGDSANVSKLTIGTHTGTHIDPPLHFIEDAAGVDAIPVDPLIGPCYVADARGRSGALEPRDLDALRVPPDTRRLLLRTDNSELWRSKAPPFPDDYTCLSEAGASWVTAREIQLVGTDFLSIEARGTPGHPTHRELLRRGVVIVEGLNLWHVEPGRYDLVVLPLLISDGDGGPARALLLPPALHPAS